MAANNKNYRKKHRKGELTLAGRDLMYKYGVIGENPDKIISKKDMTYIEDIEKDTHLASQLATRRQKLVKKEFRIKPAEKNGKSTVRAQMIRDFVMDQLQDMKGSFLKDIEAMLDATSKGFSITEKNYRLIDSGKWKGKIGLDSLRFKPAKYFSFKYDEYGHYSLTQVDPNPTGEDRPLDKYIHLIAGPNDENPYGDGVTAKCAFWVWLKKNEAKFWAIFSERFGMPQVSVQMPNNPSAEDQQKATDVINGLQTSAGIKIPKGFEVSFLEATRKGDVNYDNFIERCNKEISKVVLGATLSTEEGKRGQGSYALGHEHVGIMEDYVVFDAAMTSAAINEQLIRPLVDMNFITDEYPVFEWLGINVDSLISFAQSIGILVDRGLKVPMSWLRDQTGIPEARAGEEVLQSTTMMTLPSDGQIDEGSGDATLESLNLNGIQINAANKIIADVSSGEIPRESGINQLMIFLGLTKEQATRVIGKAGTGKKIKPDKIVNAKTPVDTETKIKGTDNRAFADPLSALKFDETIPEAVRQEITEIDKLNERYVKLRSGKYESIINKFMDSIKKKVQSK